MVRWRELGDNEWLGESADADAEAGQQASDQELRRRADRPDTREADDADGNGGLAEQHEHTSRGHVQSAGGWCGGTRVRATERFSSRRI